MEEEDHFTQTQLPALLLHLQLLQWQQGCCPCSPSLSLLVSLLHSLHSLSLCSLSLGSFLQATMVPQLQLFFNKGGCTWVAPFCQWLVQPPLTMTTLSSQGRLHKSLPINGKSQQSPPLTFIWAIVLLLLQHKLASCSSSKFTILRASLAKFTGTCHTFQSPELPKHTFSHTKGSL